MTTLLNLLRRLGEWLLRELEKGGDGEGQGPSLT